MIPLSEVTSLLGDFLNNHKVKIPQNKYRSANTQQFSPSTEVKSLPGIVRVTSELMA